MVFMWHDVVAVLPTAQALKSFSSYFSTISFLSVWSLQNI